MEASRMKRQMYISIGLSLNFANNSKGAMANLFQNLVLVVVCHVEKGI